MCPVARTRVSVAPTEKRRQLPNRLAVHASAASWKMKAWTTSTNRWSGGPSIYPNVGGSIAPVVDSPAVPTVRPGIARTGAVARALWTVDRATAADVSTSARCGSCGSALSRHSGADAGSLRSSRPSPACARSAPIRRRDSARDSIVYSVMHTLTPRRCRCGFSTVPGGTRASITRTNGLSSSSL